MSTRPRRPYVPRSAPPSRAEGEGLQCLDPALKAQQLAISGSVLATWTAVHRVRQVGEGVRAIDLSSLLSVPIHSVGLESRELGTSRGLG